MHIPDGWISGWIVLFCWSLVLIALAISVNRIKSDDISKISNIGAIAAIIFVAQMFNFPLFVGPVSGHMLGAALAVFIVGVPGAIIALFVVLLVQALVFGDGGVFAIGVNSFNIALIGVFSAYVVMKLLSKNLENKSVYYVGIFLAALVSVLLSSFFAGIFLVMSSVGEFGVIIPVIAFYHFLIGIGEGLLTVFIVAYLHQVNFPVIEDQVHPASLTDYVRESNKPLLGFGGMVLILSIFALFASDDDDGLEYVGEENDFGEGSAFELGLFDDYTFLGNQGMLGTFLAAILGVIIISGLLLLPGLYLKKKMEK
jgi:cobalt/nickel transport system permease protein